MIMILEHIAQVSEAMLREGRTLESIAVEDLSTGSIYEIEGLVYNEQSQEFYIQVKSDG